MSNKQNEIAREALFEALEDTNVVMLGAHDVSNHMQPMSPQFDDDAAGNDIWFFTETTSRLGSAARSPIDSKICLMSSSEGVYACINGKLVIDKNEAKIDKFWSPIAAAWYEKGKDDPKLTMLRFTPSDAAVWVNDANAVKFGFEIAKANVMDTTPDLGFHTTITF